jgi:serine/threonine protein kinase
MRGTEIMDSATDMSARVAAKAEPQPEIERRLGTVVAGSYRIVDHIGSGSSSHVFVAQHTRLAKQLAIKILRSELAGSPRAALRFRHEALATAKLHHEHIVSVLDCGELDDRAPFLVMELLEGEDLRGLLRREGVLPVRRAVQLVIEACRALSAVHDAGLIHRDLKPENLFITRRSTGEDWCKVLDFGVAKSDTGLTTADGAIIGTVRYMAPEQLSDSRGVDATTDVYALGAILYECLAGAPLWDGATTQETMYQIMNRVPAPLFERSPRLPRALVQVVHASLDRDRSRRPQSMAELAKLLTAALNASGPQTATNATMPDEAEAAIAPPRRAWLSQLAVFALGGVFATGCSLGLDLLIRPFEAAAPMAVQRSRLASAKTSLVVHPNPPAATPTATSSEAKLTEASVAAAPGATSEVARSRATQKVLRIAHKQPADLDTEGRQAHRVAGFDPANPYGD